MSGFYGNLEVVQIEENKWRILTPLKYQSNILGNVLEVPAGFVTDFTTVPRLPVVYLLFDGYGDRAAVVHDYLYRSGIKSRATCDLVFREALIADGVSSWRATLMYAAVRTFGIKFYMREALPWK